jgi:3-hydroxy-3-methylglutaryl CoA synthase
VPGIDRINVYVPVARIKREAIAQFRGNEQVQPGLLAIANWDEDCLTMAVEAGQGCIDDTNRGQITCVIAASTSAPYAEKQLAASVAHVLEIPADALTFDVSGSLRSGVDAVRLATELVSSTPHRSVLVVIADDRRGEPGSDEELKFGAAAVAMVVDDEGAICQLSLGGASYHEAAEVWRRNGERFVRSSDERFRGQLFAEELRGSSDDWDTTDEIFGVAVPFGHRWARRGLSDTKFAGTPVLGEEIERQIGETGVGAPWLALVQGLTTAKPGDRILVVGYSDGIDIVECRVSDKINQRRPTSRIEGLMSHGAAMSISDYDCSRREESRVDNSIFAKAEAMIWRDRFALGQLHGSVCEACGLTAYPPSRSCQRCGSLDEMSEVAIERRGLVHTFSEEYLYPTPFGTQTMAVVEAGGAHVYVQITELGDRSVNIGDRVELVYRRLRQNSRSHQYYWKARLDR